MRNVRMWRFVLIRFACAVGALTAFAFLTASLSDLGTAHHELSRTRDSSLRETHSLIASAFHSGRLEDMVALGSAYIGLGGSQKHIFLLMDADGKRIAGNVPSAHIPSGLATIRASDLDLSADLRFRTFAADLGSYRLIVGESYPHRENLGTYALTNVTWGVIGIVIFTLLNRLSVSNAHFRNDRPPIREAFSTDIDPDNLTHKEACRCK